MTAGKRMLNFIRNIWQKLTPSNAGLATEVSARLPVIKLLESQILDAVNKGNTATDQLSSSFGDMAGRARDVVNMATQSRSNDSHGGVAEVRDVVSELLTQVRQTTQSTQQTTDMLTRIEADLQNVEACMAEIEDIANRSRMVSLNGQIEAARAGEHGQGFAVVASETGDLATNVSAVSQRIRSVVDQMACSIRETSERSVRMVESDHQAMQSCEERVEQMLASLADYQSELEQNLEATKSSSDELATAISRSVMTLQFQDAVSQRMHHVTETMNEICETFEPMVPSADSGAAKRRSEELIEKLSSSYCIDDERAILEGTPTADLEPTNSSNIELF